jgi:hypothetical protein
MTGFAALAIKQAAAASGLGTGLLPAIAPSALDGFAVGTLLSGLCFLLVMAPRRAARRSKLSGRDGMWTNAPHNPMTPDLSAYAATRGYAAKAPYVTTSSFVPALAYAPAPALPAAVSDPFADESAEMVVTLLGHEQWARMPDLSNSAKHRHAGPDAAEPRPESRRNSGRHAAPPVGMSSRMASKFAFHPLAVRE